MNLTETEYILITDRVKITHAINLLKDTIPECNPAMDRNEYKNIIGILKKWEDRSFALIDEAKYICIPSEENS